MFIKMAKCWVSQFLHFFHLNTFKNNVQVFEKKSLSWEKVWSGYCGFSGMRATGSTTKYALSDRLFHNFVASTMFLNKTKFAPPLIATLSNCEKGRSGVSPILGKHAIYQ